VSADQDLSKILDILETDLRALPALEDGAGSDEEVQRHRRAFVRDSFVYFEAVVFQLKQFALEQATRDISFTASELAFLHERTYRLSQSGAAKESPAHLALPANIKFTAHMFAKAHRATFNGTYSEVGWECFLKAHRVRHRLTHPKDPADLSVSFDEVQLARHAQQWFRLWLDAVFDSIKA